MSTESGTAYPTIARRGAGRRNKSAEAKLQIYRQRLRSLGLKLAAAEERERRRIACGLHDSVMQDLIALKCGLAECPACETDPVCGRRAAEAECLIDKVIGEMRTLTFDLDCPVLHEFGLEAALEEMVDRFRLEHGIECEFKGDNRRDVLGGDIAALVFRAVRELLANVAKHARADMLSVSIGDDDSSFELVVEDDGVGFDPGKVTSALGRAAGFGLFSIRERLERVGGELRLGSARGGGARIALVVPLNHSPKADGESVK